MNGLLINSFKETGREGITIDLDRSYIALSPRKDFMDGKESVEDRMRK
jgi:hypothetical protein